jgi:hypothetical protein
LLCVFGEDGRRHLEQRVDGIVDVHAKMPKCESDQSGILIRFDSNSINDHFTRRIPLRPSDQSNRPDRHHPREHPYHWRVDSCIPSVSEAENTFQARRCLYEDVNHGADHVQSPKNDIPKLRMQIPSPPSAFVLIRFALKADWILLDFEAGIKPGTQYESAPMAYW